MGADLSITMLGFAVAAGIVVALVLVAVPRAPRPPAIPERSPVRLHFRVLFSRRQRRAITLDCLVVSVERAAPGVSVPSGLPFTLQLWAPQTPAHAARAEQLLLHWAGDDQELLLELLQEPGRVRTTITSHESSLELELAGAAGLSLTA